jgi:uncharacterized protein
MELSVAFQNGNNEQLAGYLHKPEGIEEHHYKKGIVLAHCFTCSKHVKIMRSICDALAESGFLVLRFDFSGSGESEGKFEDANYTKEMNDLDHAVDFIKTYGVKKIGALGHSMGSAVSILHGSRDSRIDSLCVVAGHSEANSIKEVFSPSDYEEIMKKGSKEVEIFGKTVVMKREFFEDAEQQDIKGALENFERPFCVIHGEDDEIIPVEHATKLYDFAAGKKEIQIIPKARHMFANEKYLLDLQHFVMGWFEKTLR